MALADILAKTQVPSKILGILENIFSKNNTKGSNYFESALDLVTNSAQISDNFYYVKINPHKLLIPGLNDTPMLCIQSSLPGKVLATTNQKTYGPLQKFPIMTTFEDCNLTFMCITDNHGQMYPRIAFEQWLEYINPQNKYDFKYKDNYIASIDIEVYNKAGDQVYEVTLNEAFPLAIHTQQMSFSGQNFMFCSVTFTYTDYSYEDTTGGLQKDEKEINIIESAIKIPESTITPTFSHDANFNYDVSKYENPTTPFKNFADIKFEHQNMS